MKRMKVRCDLLKQAIVAEVLFWKGMADEWPEAFREQVTVQGNLSVGKTIGRVLVRWGALWTAERVGGQSKTNGSGLEGMDGAETEDVLWKYSEEGKRYRMWMGPPNTKERTYLGRAVPCRGAAVCEEETSRER